MRIKRVIGNWKMQGSRQSIAALLAALVQKPALASIVEMAVLPPAVYLQAVQQALHNTPIAWGAQNVAAESVGAFTGEIAASMLTDFNCRYVLVGHSERRHYYQESNDIIAKKFALAQAAGLIPILCVGETLAEREAGLTEQIVGQQLAAILNLANNAEHLARAVLAYEPVWAIGTGLTATPEQAQAIHALLRAQVAQHSPTIAEQLSILYGGSVKASNARALFAMPDIDGALVGGASLDATEFLQIFHSF